MRRRRVALIGCLVWSLAAAIASVVLAHFNGPATANFRHADDVAVLAFILAPGIAGVLTLRNGLRSVAGWLLVGTTTGATTGLLVHELAVAVARDGHEAPWLNWPALWLVGPSLGLLALVPARIRDGWPRRFEPLAVAALLAVSLALAFGPEPVTGVGSAIDPLENPLAIASAEPAARLFASWAPLCLLVYAALGLLALASDIPRRRRTQHVPEQLPWLLLGAVLLPSVALAALVGAVTDADAVEAALWVGVLVPLGVLAITSVVIWRRWLAERQESERLRHSARARDQERERVRRDLHDGIGPALAGMRLHLEVLRDGLPEAAATSRAAAARLEQSLDETLVELRRIVDGMQPAALETLGFKGALELLRSSLTSTWAEGRAKVDLHVDPALPELPRPVESALLRVCAEALSNSVRHGDPTQCRVSIDWAEGAAHLLVVDDGTGINGTDTSHGVGLRSMRARIEEVGGTLEVSRPDSGHGTAVTAVVPVRG